MYLTLNEFEARLTALSALTGSEYKRKLATTALEHAHTALNAELSKRYQLPIDLQTIPQRTRDLLQRWVFYFAVRELLGLQGVSVSRDVQPVLSEVLEMIDTQVADYCTGNAILEGIPAQSRVRIGYGESSNI